MLQSIYGKAFLYSYTHIDTVCKEIEECMKKKAHSSISNTSPAVFQCEELAVLGWQIDVLQSVKVFVKEALKQFTQEELKLLDYKYFKRLKKDEFENVDTTSRGYFRKQTNLVNKFCKVMFQLGVNDVWLKNCLNVRFFKMMVKRVSIMEEQNNKNKPKKQKTLCTVRPNKIIKKGLEEKQKDKGIA